MPQTVTSLLDEALPPEHGDYTAKFQTRPCPKHCVARDKRNGANSKDHRPEPL